MPQSCSAITIKTQPTAAVVHGTATIIGGLVPIAEYAKLTLLIEYVKGDETNVSIYPVFMDEAGGIEAPWDEWAEAAGVNTPTANVLRLAASGSYEYTFDVEGHVNAAIYEYATGGTPTGTLKMTIVLKGCVI